MKTTYKAGDDFKLLIDKVSLNEVEKEILKVQWLNELNFADLKANKCKKKFQIIKTTVFIAGVLIPAFVNLDLGTYDKFNLSKIIVTVLGIIVSIGTGLNQIYKYEDQWMNYRRNAELLKSEGENFFGLGGAYRASENHEAALRDFNTNVSNIKRQDVSNYFEKVVTQDKDKNANH